MAINTPRHDGHQVEARQRILFFGTQQHLNICLNASKIATGNAMPFVKFLKRISRRSCWSLRSSRKSETTTTTTR
ncbi:hypothetical protein ACLKA6_011968 [Drosophila palustris]